MNSEDTIQTSNRPAVIPNDAKDMMKDANGISSTLFRPETDKYDLGFWVGTAITVFAAGVVLGVLVSRKD